MLAALRQDAPAAAPRLDYTDHAMREVPLATRQEGVLTFDGDLTGREVAPTSRDYPDAAYGWMGDHVGLGYQAAVVSLRSNSYFAVLELAIAGRRRLQLPLPLLKSLQNPPPNTIWPAVAQQLR